jgi:hypothetical protein
MGIGLDDYIFNNSKRTEFSSVTKSPRKTKATVESLNSRTDEKNSNFLFSRDNSSRAKGAHTDGQNTALKTPPIPHIGIQDDNLLAE